jgi:protein transport protein SEC24
LVQVQLILPEALKLLPLYSLALHKSNMLRPDVRADDRSSWLAGVVGASPQRTMGLLHPRLFAVHNLLVRTSAVTPAAPACVARSACSLNSTAPVVGYGFRCCACYSADGALLTGR